MNRKLDLMDMGGYDKVGEIDLADLDGNGEAYPTSRDTSQTADIGYTEYMEPCTLPDGRKARIVYLFCAADEMTAELEEDLPWDASHVKHVELVELEE